MVFGKVEISLFDGRADFNLCSRRIRSLMSHIKVLIALEPKLEKLSEDQKKRKAEIDEATNLLVLSLLDCVLRKADSCFTLVDIWNKLESLFANQIVPNLAYVKVALFAYKMDPAKSQS